MTLKSFIFGKQITICCLFIAIIAFSGTLLLAGVPLSLIMFFSAFLLVLIIIWLILSYFFVKQRIKKLDRQLDILDKKYLVGELLCEPASAEEKLYFNLMKSITRSAIEEIEAEKRKREDYYDCVTAWVHEMKTPLTAASLIVANNGDMHKLRAELKRADNLTESILYYARLSSAEKDLQIVHSDLRELVHTALHTELELLIAAKLSVTVNGEGYAYADEKLLLFVLKQFFINCAKYCMGCSLTVDISSDRLIITDNGPGIPSSEIDRVCDRGFTGKAYRHSGGSTGMGLFISKRLCEQMNINMSIEAEEGKYTKITLLFT